MSRIKLRDAFSILRNISQQEPKAFDLRPTKIAEAAATFHYDRPIKPPRPRPDILPKWTIAVQSNDYSSITLSDVRGLFWEKEVALRTSFLNYVRNQEISVRRSSLKGLSFVLASRWSEVIDGTIQLPQLRDLVSQLSTSDFFTHLRPYIFDARGHDTFAKLVVDRKSRLLDAYSEVFGIVMSSNPYTTEVLKVLSETAYKTALSTSPSEREWFYTNVLSSIQKSLLLPCLGRIVNEIENTNAEEPKEELKGFILGHPNLGDPRLPGLEGNWDQTSPITQSIIEWLSQSDINLFFELFFQDKADVQGRKRFWLPYAHRIRGTRVIVSDADEKRLFRQLKDLDGKKLNRNILGELIGTSGNATAFIMDFGNVKVVEFSLPNHACYFYDEKAAVKINDRAYFWSSKQFRERELKDQSRCTERMSHREGWESRFARFLAEHGVRPKQQLWRY